MKDTVWSSRVLDCEGKLKHLSDHNLNLRTNAGNDWQSRVMNGDGSSAYLQGTSTATSATSISHASFTTSHIDHLVGATGATYGVITAVSGGVATVDKWYNPASPAGAAASTPAAASNFQVMPGSAPMVYLILSSSAVGTATDTALAGELTTNGFARSYWTTYTHSAGSSSTLLGKTFTAAGTATINSEGLGNALTGGTLGFESAETSPPTLVAGDTLAQNVTTNY